MRRFPPGRRSLSVVAAALLTAAGVAFAQSPGQSPLPAAKGAGPAGLPSQATPRLGPTDTSFLMRAAEGGLYEVAAGKLAASRANSPEVRAFGETLVKDHSGSNEKLAALARDHGVMLPGVIPAKEEIVLERLRKLSGTEFDRQFVQTVGIDAHRETIALFQKAVSSVQSDAVRSFAKGALPTLQAHLATAQKLARLTAKLAADGAGDQSSTTTRP